MFNKQSLLATLLLGGAVILTSWYSVKVSESALPQPATATTLNGIANTVQIAEYDRQGQLVYQGQAAKALQYTNQWVTLIDLKGVHYTQDRSPPWNASADQAFIAPNNTSIELLGHVLLSRPSAVNYAPLEFSTTDLLIYPNKNYAYTSEKVLFREPSSQNQTTAVGMKLYQAPLKIDLLSHVKSTYTSGQNSTILPLSNAQLKASS